ncbi:Cation transporter HKT2 [Acorus calamus]|uniref:Cation transporter HKT2 n=1 Tax=Acorus calamus TaxID=4465 RepID=A0AAV9CLN6_ACOCL|nr:Cation transporter HKT2 [Acorus calamus]
MEIIIIIIQKMRSFVPPKLKSMHNTCMCLLHFLLFRVNPFLINLFYFISISLLGSLALSLMNPRVPSQKPSFIDTLYLSVSASTVSGLATVEMEVLSNAQLVVLTLLMLFGGEVFVSMLSLPFNTIKHKQRKHDQNRVADSLESGNPNPPDKDLKLSSMKHLFYVVFGYHAAVVAVGAFSIALYVTRIAGAREVLARKGLRASTFSASVAISSFANAGLIPTNENMAIFRSDSGLLLMVVPLVLLGNTLFPLFLQLAIWVLKRVTGRPEFDYMLGRHDEIRFRHLLPNGEYGPLTVGVLGIIVAQVVLFCAMDWRSDGLAGLSPYRKIIVSLFQGVNSRHAGESAVDFSVVSAAVLVLCIAAMYLPAYTSFLPLGTKQGKQRKGRLIEFLHLSQIAYILVFVILVCIIEKNKMRDDPVNFSFLNVLFEVVSAYGNVGFSVSYSCARRLNTDGACVDKAYGFSGWWSDAGKLIIIFVMLFGRLKRFTMHGGKSWRLR